MQKLVTVGGYGHTEDSFLQMLKAVNVDTFIDIRQRRGMRGSKYAFLNSSRLQTALRQAGIRYLHIKELAPTSSVRAVQLEADKDASINKQARACLSREFVEAYSKEILADYDTAHFNHLIGADAKIVALFCVEGPPEACHRSLAAQKLAANLGVALEHIRS